MVSKSGKSPVGQRLDESFEDKHDRRLEFHEILRSRYNITSCRQDGPGWGREQEKHSPREQEFFRRRHLWTDEYGDKRLRSPPKEKRSIRYSPMKQQNLNKSLSDDRQHIPSSSQDSHRHNRSKTYPFNYPSMKLSTLNNIDDWNPLYRRMKRNNTEERGVQTVQDMPVICLKRNSSQQTE